MIQRPPLDLLMILSYYRQPPSRFPARGMLGSRSEDNSVAGKDFLAHVETRGEHNVPLDSNAGGFHFAI